MANQPDLSLPDPVDRQTFVSHASEDKPYVRELVNALLRYGIDPWYDEYEIGPGDSIRGKINDGLRKSEYGIVVLSHDFFAKRWPTQELAALANLLEAGNLIPILHGIAPSDLGTYDPLLLDIHGLRSTEHVHATGAKLAEKILGRPPLGKDGRSHYVGRTLLLRDLPLSEDYVLHDMSFDDCTLLGFGVIALWRNVTLSNLALQGPESFIAVPEGTRMTGVIPAVNVTFNRTRFQDIGFIVTTELRERIFREMPHR
jgi:hypothetical protein